MVSGYNDQLQSRVLGCHPVNETIEHSLRGGRRIGNIENVSGNNQYINFVLSQDTGQPVQKVFMFLCPVISEKVCPKCQSAVCSIRIMLLKFETKLAIIQDSNIILFIFAQAKIKIIMKILYYIYQICIALPILLVLTILTAIVTIIGSLLGGAHIWDIIRENLVTVDLPFPVDSGKVRGREKLHGRTSYIFVPNHQGSFDIFLIYGFLGRNFKWMMKKSLRKIPL